MFAHSWIPRLRRRILLSKKKVESTTLRFLGLLVLGMLACFGTSFSQIHIREKVDINKEAFQGPSLMKPGQPSAVVSGFAIPKGLRNRLQVYYGALERLDEEIPWYARLKTIRSDTLGHDTTLYDQATDFRFPNLLINPETFIDWCGWWGENHNKYYYTPTAATELYDIMRVVPRDTVVFGYITQIVGEGRTDTLGIFSADTVKLFADSTIVGWNVSFADYNNCLFTWNEKMDVFVALNCPEYVRWFTQFQQSWADSAYLYYLKYDTTIAGQDTTITSRPYKISEKGCALTTMALVGKAVGLSIDPDTLNRFKKHNRLWYGKDTSMVDWNALTLYPNRTLSNSIVKYDTSVGTGIYRHPRTKQLTGTPQPLSLIDPFLARCKPVIVQVSNPPGQYKNHWVIVTRKEPNGDYTIVDPGSASRTLLSQYGSTIYKIVAYESKP